MTKMNGINLPDMADDIFNENIIKRKKTQIDYDLDKKSDGDTDTLKYGNNNNIDKLESPQNLKRKSKFDNYDIDKIVQSNMIIDKESSKVRLEMRDCSELDYKTNGHVEDLDEVGTEGNEYALKNGNGIPMGEDKILNNNDGDYSINGDYEHGSEVSFPIFFYCVLFNRI
ncbi:uncharacterized protein LOC113493873 [Trichoplusia ni]|uniref:Uncharacterized protein LOC113493873 n=1 Tax=Trichoplusia ni TaxID=7111 RepID=A0A7E5VHM6_TRINI|nr:uncharacterized protein LOC113493873 [Trichoplusia ni]